MSNTKSTGYSGNKVSFDSIDPFNQNRVEGFIFRSKGRYGDILISRVNGLPCEQYIYSTPRILHLEKNLHQCKRFSRLKVFEKIDGTNILLYNYKDALGNRFTSYKTRLSPFLHPQPYGDFPALWKKILEKYKAQFARLTAADYSYGFELYGSTLRILTDYETELDARLLYALDPENGKIIEPEAGESGDFPVASKIADFPGDAPVQEVYKRILDGAISDFDQGKLVEGAMFYFIDGRYAAVYKGKPPEVITRQKRYGELYQFGKNTARTGMSIEKAQKKLAQYIDLQWDDPTKARYRRVIEIVTEDITNEMRFNRKQEEEKTPSIFNQKIIWKSTWGSHLWGMNREDSDDDCCIVYQVDSNTLFLSPFNHDIIQPHLHGKRRKSGGADEHWYELGRAVQLILKGSLTMLYGVMSPLVQSSHMTALEELQDLIRSYPSKIFYKILLRDVRESEKAMRRAKDRNFYLKHLRIACRNLQFGITLFTHNRYEFLPCYTEDPQHLENLKEQIVTAYAASPFPETFDPAPFEQYILRWRKKRVLEDN